MPRANRYFLPGYVWHITHRCHKKEFLLKFHKDRMNWIRWLFASKKRYGLCVLNYIVTSNHIHLLVQDTGNDAIPKSMQLIAGRVGQAYNQRKQRKGAFWEDRYHATAVDTDTHLARCLTYIDLNMVRTGVVKHPKGWVASGYHEIQTPSQRYRIVDLEALKYLLEIDSLDELQLRHLDWIDSAIHQDNAQYDAMWSQSIAVGSEAFVEDVKAQLGLKAKHRETVDSNGAFFIKEGDASYTSHLIGEIDVVSRN